MCWWYRHHAGHVTPDEVAPHVLLGLGHLPLDRNDDVDHAQASSSGRNGVFEQLDWDGKNKHDNSLYRCTRRLNQNYWEFTSELLLAVDIVAAKLVAHSCEEFGCKAHLAGL